MNTTDRVTTGKAAAVLGCATNTVRKLVRLGIVPAEATPYGLLFRPEDLYRLLGSGWRPAKAGRPRKESPSQEQVG